MTSIYQTIMADLKDCRDCLIPPRENDGISINDKEKFVELCKDIVNIWNFHTACENDQ